MPCSVFVWNSLVRIWVHFRSTIKGHLCLEKGATFLSWFQCDFEDQGRENLASSEKSSKYFGPVTLLLSFPAKKLLILCENKFRKANSVTYSLRDHIKPHQESTTHTVVALAGTAGQSAFIERQLRAWHSVLGMQEKTRHTEPGLHGAYVPVMWQRPETCNKIISSANKYLKGYGIT